MIPQKLVSLSSRLGVAALITLFLNYTTASAEPVDIPVNTRVYVETMEAVSGKESRTSEGQIVRASVWRDVIVDGRTVIEAGTPVLVRVDSIKGSKVAGIKGKMSLGAYETTLVDGTIAQLGGGYYKEGKGRMALAASLGWLFIFPIFIKGKTADIPRGMVFDAYFDQKTVANVPDLSQPAHTVDLTSVMDEGFVVEVLYDELEGVKEPKIFAFAIRSPITGSGEFVIDTLNGEAIEPIRVSTIPNGLEGETKLYRGEVAIKAMGKHFRKGINTFEMATTVDGERMGKEIVLDVQF